MTQNLTKILLAEDEKFIRSAFQEGLGRVGFELIIAKNGEEALAKIAEEKPALILLDLIMPKLTGYEVLKRLQADDSLKDIPVVVLSNLSQATDEAEVRALGAKDFIVKSDYSLKEIADRIRKLL